MDARWKPMLCESADAMPEDPGAWVLEPKFDGWRTLVVIESTGVTVIGGRNDNTYSGKVPYIESALAGALPDGTVIDGELIDPQGGWNGVQSVMTSGIAHKPSALSPALTLVAFDVLQVNGRDLRALEWENRRAVLEMVEWPANTYLSPTGTADAATHVRMLELGMEGSVIKRRDGVYQSGRRSTMWLKLKAIATEDCEIVGFEDGKNGRAGEVGAILVKLPSGITTTASGMTDKVRADMLANPDNYLGKLVEIAHNGIMASGKPRHPRFKRMRDDRSPATPPKPPATSPRRSRAGGSRMRNYKAMGDQKLRDCMASFKAQSGDCYSRAEQDVNFSVEQHRRACHEAALARGWSVPAF
jgi:ATP-dependent DNA ligase